MNETDLDHHLAGCGAAHRRLIGHLEALLGSGTLTDTTVATPSRLPGWSVGHVLTHLARNADSHTRVIDGALRGEVTDQYAGGAAGRGAEIEAGAARGAEALVDDVRTSIVHLETAWGRATEQGWQGTWRSPAVGERPLFELAFRRWREVEVHHADLGLPGFDIDDWSSRYVAEELRIRTMEWTSRQPMGLTTLPQAALRLAPAVRLAWLLGRVTPEGLDPVQYA